jgi:hypothetical protein
MPRIDTSKDVQSMGINELMGEDCHLRRELLIEGMRVQGWVLSTLGDVMHRPGASVVPGSLFFSVLFPSRYPPKRRHDPLSWETRQLQMELLAEEGGPRVLYSNGLVTGQWEPCDSEIEHLKRAADVFEVYLTRINREVLQMSRETRET